jgi:predicted transcriptional regulator
MAQNRSEKIEGDQAGRFLTPAEAAAALHECGIKVSISTLKNWRSTGTDGPRFHKVAGRAYYRQADIDEWLAEAQRAPLPATPGESTFEQGVYTYSDIPETPIKGFRALAATLTSISSKKLK